MLFVLLFGWFCFNWCSTVAHVLRYYNPLPVSDYWRVVEDLPAMENGGLGWLWRQHNEHRITFPEIVFALDQQFLAGRQVLPLFVSFFCYVGSVVLLGRAFWREINGSAAAKAAALLLGGAIAGWPLSTFVLGTSFLLQWTLVQFAVVLALVSLTKLIGNSARMSVVYLQFLRGRGYIFVCQRARTLALFSLAMAAALRAPRKYVVVFGCVAVASHRVVFCRLSAAEGSRRRRSYAPVLLHWLS